MSDADIAVHARALADGIEAAIPTWVVRCVANVMTAWAGAVPPEVAEAAEVAGQEARVDIGGRVRALLEADIDDQATTPMAAVRGAVSYPTRVLHDAGVPPVVRDRFTEEVFPDDVYGLTPSAFADLEPSLAELGIAWGAAKAFDHKRRHRATG